MIERIVLLLQKIKKIFHLLTFTEDAVNSMDKKINDLADEVEKLKKSNGIFEGFTVVILTQKEYDELENKNANTLYFIREVI